MTRGDAWRIKADLADYGLGDVAIYAPRIARPVDAVPSGDEEGCHVVVHLMHTRHELRSIAEYHALMERFRA
jgi:hypothetical protein